MENTNTKENKGIVYIMVAVAVLLFAYIAYSVIQNNNNKNMENTNQTENQSKVAEVGDILVINYSGKLENGTEFDSSYKRGQPLVFQIGVGQVIAGWEEGLIGVKKGDKKTLTITADKAYGDQEIKDPQTGAVVIPANSTLIFDVEVVEVVSRADAERMFAEQQAASMDQGTTTTE